MHQAIENLKTNQRQLDADGCEVGVSRQALNETLEIVAVMFAALEQADETIGYSDLRQGTGHAVIDAAIAKAKG